VERKVHPRHTTTPDSSCVPFTMMAAGELAQNAEEVAKLGKELYDRIRTLSGHWSEVGEVGQSRRSLTTAPPAPSESRVIVSTRRFKDLKVGACDSEIVPLKQIR